MATTTLERPLLIDPNGDVLLIVGTTGKSYLRVQSKVLSLASKVFMTMFSQNFMEGMGLSSASEPYSIPLPEDDPAAMTLLCKLLHFQHSSLTSTPHSYQLRVLAITAHKYDCAAAVSSMSTMWLLQTSFHMCCGCYPDDDLLVASYLLNNHDSFKDVTKQAVYAKSGWFTAGYGKLDIEVLPKRLVAALETRRVELQLHMNKRLRAIPFKVTDRSAGTATPNLTTDSQLPKCALRRLEQYSLELIRVGLVEVECCDASLLGIISKLRRFGIKNSALKKCTGPCKYCDYDLNSGVKGLASDLEESFGGFCLHCTQEPEHVDCDCEGIF